MKNLAKKNLASIKVILPLSKLTISLQSMYKRRDVKIQIIWPQNFRQTETINF